MVAAQRIQVNSPFYSTPHYCRAVRLGHRQMDSPEQRAESAGWHHDPLGDTVRPHWPRFDANKKAPVPVLEGFS
jgi:hypothetical protein